jgi:periplasmic divalent cation tolerance protein
MWAVGRVFGVALPAFWHESEFGEGEEWQVVLKTRADPCPEIEAHLIENHPWQNPEVTAIEISDGCGPYLLDQPVHVVAGMAGKTCSQVCSGEHLAVPPRRAPLP